MRPVPLNKAQGWYRPHAAWPARAQGAFPWRGGHLPGARAQEARLCAESGSSPTQGSVLTLHSLPSRGDRSQHALLTL